MKYIAFLYAHLKRVSFLFLITIVAACSKHDEGEQLNNVKTDKHTKMPGTNVFLIAPKDFVTRPASDGIMYAEFGANSMKSATIYVSQFERAFEGKIDTKDSSMHPIRVNQYNGYYKSENNGDGLYKEGLYFGNKNVSVSIHAEILTRDTAFVKTVRNAIHTAVLIDEELPDPADDAAFKVDITGTKLKFARLLNGMLIYNNTGNNYSASGLDFIIAFKYAMTGPKEKQEEIAQKYLREELYYKDVNIKESKIITIDGMQGYEITADGIHTSNNNHEAIYLVTLFVNDGAYVMLGTTNVLFDYQIEMFRKVALTFHLKEQQKE